MRAVFLVMRPLVLVMLVVAPCWSHGVDGIIEPAEGYCVTAQYDDGEPMSYAAVEIKAPDSQTGFQTGRTDRNGCFMFRPDGQGRWQAVVQDGMGHRLALDLEVGNGIAAPEKAVAGSPVTAEAMTRPVKVLAGLSIIFGMCGLFYGWKARRVS